MLTDECINAKDLLDDPDSMQSFQTPYLMVRDNSMMGTYKNLMTAVNWLFEYGWDVVSISRDDSGTMFVMLKNANAKRKRDKMMQDFE
jgi:hypothetical protein